MFEPVLKVEPRHPPPISVRMDTFYYNRHIDDIGLEDTIDDGNEGHVEFSDGVSYYQLCQFHPPTQYFKASLRRDEFNDQFKRVLLNRLLLSFQVNRI